MEKRIYLGQVERNYFLGFKKWTPLTLDWEKMRCHGIIKVEHGSNWFAVLQNIIGSILKQNGRVLIIDRRQKDPQEDAVDIQQLMFGEQKTHSLTDLHDSDFFQGFLNSKKEWNNPNRLFLLPESLAFQHINLHGNEIPLITHQIRNAIGFIIGSPIDTSKEDLSSEQALWKNSPPVLIITLGKPWYENQSVLAAQLRAVSIASFHILFSLDGLDERIDANSINKIFLFAKKSNGEEKDTTDGFVHFVEDSPKVKWEKKSVNALFRA